MPINLKKCSNSPAIIKYKLNKNEVLFHPHQISLAFGKNVEGSAQSSKCFGVSAVLPIVTTDNPEIKRSYFQCATRTIQNAQGSMACGSEKHLSGLEVWLNLPSKHEVLSLSPNNAPNNCYQ
jgi:hypothetical protein